MKNRKIVLIFLAIVVIVILVILVTNQKEDKKDFEAGISIGSEFTIVDRVQNVASVSMTSDDDVIAYSGDITATLSVGDAVLFERTASIAMPSPLISERTYYVSVASRSGFEISDTRGGSSIDLTNNSTGGETFYQEIGPSYLNVADSRHITMFVSLGQQPSLSIKFAGSIQDNPPDWYASRSNTNQWEYIGVYDLEDAALIPGDTGLSVFTGVEDERMFMINTDILQWVTVVSDHFASGNVTITAKTSD